MERTWHTAAFIGSGFFAVGAAAGFPVGFFAAIMMMVR